MATEWFKPRGYRHFDRPISVDFAEKAMDGAYVASHSFSPLIHYLKTEKRYKRLTPSGPRSVVLKERPIKYASHKDACIFSYYGHLLEEKLENHYSMSGLNRNVIAYRGIGLSNYDFAAEALRFAHQLRQASILAFDVSSFFDTLDHALLKSRLKNLLGVSEIPEDWYKVFQSITRFHFVEIDALKAHNKFGARLKHRTRDRICSLRELKEEKIKIHINPELLDGRRRGIPQGTPISAVMSNLYMVEFDTAAAALAAKFGALYRRYSDDILLICSPEHSAAAEVAIKEYISREKLDLSESKTERTHFDIESEMPRAGKAAQYLGFNLLEQGATIRESSLSRQWRKMRQAIKRTRKIALSSKSDSKGRKVYLKKLTRRFTCVKVNRVDGLKTIRNFSAYGRRSCGSFAANQKIKHQVKRLEKAAALEIAKLKALRSTQTSQE
ncbi:reverse transcriptase/maturase family protein [Falsiroseomonas sp. HC035]|uniref:reverse transcriptase/maturase family protein n=1 Tax=Falsiroseomonas sp. HC035 TaxID=3390999 RepID=UPI003D311E49